MTTETSLPVSSRPHYVSNKDFYAAMKEYIAEVKKAEDAGEERPQPNDYICQCFIKIAHKYANRPNFLGYSYRDEMIGDAILTCIMRCHKFDPEKSNNPFAYFTQYCHNAFLQRIKREKNQTNIKGKYIAESMSSDFIDTQFNDEDADFRNNFIEFLKENSVYVDTNVTKPKAKESKKKDDSTLESFMDSDTGDANDEEETE